MLESLLNNRSFAILSSRKVYDYAATYVYVINIITLRRVIINER